MPRPSAPASKRLKLRDASESASEASRSSTKSRGKMTRSNEKIGGLAMETACRVAENVTGYHFIDLRLPHREEADAANSLKWISTFDPEDVVIQRKLCMICLLNPMDAFLKTHVSTDHPQESSEVTEVMKRLSDVRYTRFCSNGYVSRHELAEKYSSSHKVVNFLANRGILIVNENKRSKKFAPKPIDYEKKFEEADVRGVSKSNARSIVSKFGNLGLLFREELEFSSELVTNTRMLDPSTQTTALCHLCGKVANLKNFPRHMKTHKDWVHESCSLVDLTEIFKRITDLRTALYYSAQPVRVEEIDAICCSEEERNSLIEFLLDSGFVVDQSIGEDRQMEKRKKMEKIVVVDPECAEVMPTLSILDGEDLEREEEDDVEEESMATSSDSCSERSRSRSSSVTSDSSSASSSTTSSSSSSSRINLRPCSSPSDEPFPYCILNAIPEHIEVEHALYDILEAMTDDSSFVPDQAQFQFLLGYSTYCLVVGNGSKQNVISRLTLGDFHRAQEDESSGLHYFSFSTRHTFSQTESVEYLCADERIWRALEIFEVARERRAKEANWREMEEEDSTFFCSYVSPSAILKDTNYPMSQFLRMCGISWPCRSGAICSAAWSLVNKDSGKLGHHQYAITYFKMLREKERSQAQLLDEGGRISSHPTYKKISLVTVRRLVRSDKMAPHEKVRKKQKRYPSADRKGVEKKPRGGDHKSEEYLRRMGREVPEKRRKIKEEKEKKEEVIEDVKVEVQTIHEEVRPNCEVSEIIDVPSPSPTFPEYRIEMDGELTLTCL